MITIHLNKLLFYSYHGVHAEEKQIGGKFEVSLSIKYKPATVPVATLAETINYVIVYEVVKKRMEQPTELLETIATTLASDILAQFSLAEEVEISITKLNPPIANLQGSVGVSFNLIREQ